MISDYRKMRLLLMFDLPTTEPEDVKNYNLFIKNLKKIGFYMLQYSIYIKSTTNQSDFEKTYKKVIRIIPPKGNVILLKLTDKQYNDMIYLNGEKNKYDSIVGSNAVVYIGGERNS